jgi:peptidyl-prolyl cis-trans isomerase D
MATRNQALILWGDEFFKLEKQLNLEAQAWDRLVLLEEVNRRRIKASDEEVAAVIQGYPFFQKDAKFDLEIYERLLKYMFYTQPRVFEEQMRDNIKIRKLYETVTFEIKLTPQEIRNEYKKENEEARVDYLAALPSNFIAGVVVEEKEIEEYFKKNILQFKKPETFNLEYMQLLYAPEAKEADIKIIDEKAQSVFLSLKKKNMQVAAKENALEIKETGFFSLNDPIPGIGWSPEIIAIVNKLKNGQLAPLIHTPKGWYFIKLKENRQPYLPAFEEVKKEAREKLIQAKSKATAKKKIEAALSKIRDMYKINPRAIDFNKLAKEFNLKSDQTQFFKRASYIPGIGTSDKFFNGIADIKVGEVSTILDLEQGFYIVRLKEFKNIDEQEYLKEKEGFSSRLLSLRKEKVFLDFLEGLKKEATLTREKFPFQPN